MPSLRDGAYRLVGAVQGSSPDRWYRQLIDARQPYANNGAPRLSCDCPAWINNQGGDRTCKHTRMTAQLLGGVRPAGARAVAGDPLTITTVRAMQPLIQGIQGSWQVAEFEALLADAAYRFSLLQVQLPGGGAAAAFVAMARRHAPHLQDVSAAVAAWAGWAVAAEIARLGGFGEAGAPPDNFYRFRPGARGPARIGVRDLLAIGNQTEQGDGLRPQERAEHTLRLFLGPLYESLGRQGFLDVASKRSPGTIYRLRLDPARRYDRRVRVFEHGRYVRDLCIVRNDRLTPVQDGFLTVFMGLLSDEQHVLRVVAEHNIFPPYSDSDEPEHIPAGAGA
ncbi:MAG TPA: hypothetical protein VFS21_24400 [Roseiflexaceae bacterium]|nr:hypothetical protein [Roseiflexaceae bacterium]